MNCETSLNNVLNGKDEYLIVTTSGSTGNPKKVMLSRDALAASAHASAQALLPPRISETLNPQPGSVSGPVPTLESTSAPEPAQWLLALPTEYIAGLMVLVRSHYAGTTPVRMDPTKSFTPERFIAAAEQLEHSTRFTSLVPTQLHRLLDHAGALNALRSFTAVLLGGAQAHESLLAQAREQGIHIVTTYGSTETCGGCVYNGEPLPGVQVRLDRSRVLLTGPMLADGYLNDPEREQTAFPEYDGYRWYRSDDLGEFFAGALRILGRVDDMVITGGIKVSSRETADALLNLPGVTEAFVTGLPDTHWGQKLAAAVVLDPGCSLDSVRELAALNLPTVQLPKRWLVLPSFPQLAHGKLDRQSLVLQLQVHGNEGKD